jgi:hypothetical protein
LPDKAGARGEQTGEQQQQQQEEEEEEEEEEEQAFEDLGLRRSALWIDQLA